MRVLALDTTTRALSAAVVEDDRVLAERVDDSLRSHAERLPGDLLTVLEAARVPLPEIDVFAVAAGPGSFTGLRIGIATLQGFALVNRRRIVAVSALEALAHVAACSLAPDATVGVWIDAHRREVFSALYRTCPAPPFHRDSVVEVDPPAVGPPAAAMRRWQEAGRCPAVFTGSGTALYRHLIAEGARILDAVPLAPAVGRMAAVRAAAGEAVDPAAVQPLYIRRPDAELARDRNQPPWLPGTSNP